MCGWPGLQAQCLADRGDGREWSDPWRGEFVVLEVCAAQPFQAGAKFFLSDHGVWSVVFVPPQDICSDEQLDS